MQGEGEARRSRSERQREEPSSFLPSFLPTVLPSFPPSSDDNHTLAKHVVINWMKELGSTLGIKQQSKESV